MKMRHMAELLALWVITLLTTATAAASGRDFTYMLGNTQVVLNQYAAGGRGGYTFFAPTATRPRPWRLRNRWSGKAAGTSFGLRIVTVLSPAISLSPWAGNGTRSTPTASSA